MALRLLFTLLLVLLARAGVAAAATSTAATPAPAAPGEQVWLAASDFHLDPFDRSAQASRFGSDSNLALFAAALARMKRAVPDPAVVLLPGDFFVHDFPHVATHAEPSDTPETTAEATMRTIAAAFDRAFPRAQFAIVPGNNDAPCGDYRSVAGSAYAAAIARIWAPLVNRNGAAAQFAASFARDGYYTASLPVRGLRLVALDTVLLSNQYAGACDGAPGSAARELDWLGATLRATPPGQRNLVMMHIPPGYDAFTTQALLAAAPGGVRLYPGIVRDAFAKLKNLASAAAPWPFLKPAYGAQLVDALAAPQDRVAYALAGHSHHFDFRLAGGVPVIVIGSISPVYHNNPSFYALHVGRDGSLRDIDTYAYDDATQAWLAPHDFARTWSVARVDAASLVELHRRLGADAALRRAWGDATNGWPSGGSAGWNAWGPLWRVSWCAQSVLDGGFTRCAGVEGRVFAMRALLGAGLLLVLAIPIAAVVVAYRRRTRQTSAAGVAKKAGL